MPEPSILDARLAEIDRRLRMIQSGLEPVPEPPEDPGSDLSASAPDTDLLLAAPPPTSLTARRMVSPQPPVATDTRDEEIAALTARLSELTAAHERLLATTRDLLVEQADMLAKAASGVSVAVGPFTGTRALQEFQKAVAELPQVREVTIREYVGAGGVILDVHLQAPIS